MQQPERHAAGRTKRSEFRSQARQPTFARSRSAANDDTAPELIPPRRQNGYLFVLGIIALLIFGARVLGLLP